MFKGLQLLIFEIFGGTIKWGFKITQNHKDNFIAR